MSQVASGFTKQMARNMFYGGSVFFALLFAALDLREVVHQLQESRISLVVIALAAALLHGAVVVLAGLSLTQRSSSTV